MPLSSLHLLSPSSGLLLARCWESGLLHQECKQAKIALCGLTGLPGKKSLASSQAQLVHKGQVSSRFRVWHTEWVNCCISHISLLLHRCTELIRILRRQKRFSISCFSHSPEDCFLSCAGSGVPPQPEQTTVIIGGPKQWPNFENLEHNEIKQNCQLKSLEKGEEKINSTCTRDSTA